MQTLIFLSWKKENNPVDMITVLRASHGPPVIFSEGTPQKAEADNFIVLNGFHFHDVTPLIHRGTLHPF